MRRLLPFLLSCLVAIGLLAPTALGAGEAEPGGSSPVSDQGSSFHYRSVITAVTPAVPDLSVQVLQFADRLQLINHTHSTVTIYGYQDEPYARVLADGTAEQNSRSPATYLNQSFYGDVNVPPQADPKATPSWQVIDRTGQLEWHDHRIHYTSPAVPPQVKDQGKRTLIFNWRVPIAVGSRRGAIAGQLFWVPENSKAPLAAILVGSAIVIAGLAIVLVVRRRRGVPPKRPGASAAGGEPADPPREAW